MANFTPQEINEILAQFFSTVGRVQYIGARYVPIFGRKDEDTIEWDGGLAPYESLTIVLHQGNSYTSRQYVPAGIDISNEEYWAQTGNYNGQIEKYRADVAALALQLREGLDKLDYFGSIIPADAFTPQYTMLDRINALTRPNSFHNINYLGRIYIEQSYNGRNAAACTLTDDDTLFLFLSNDVDTSYGELFKVKVSTGAVTMHRQLPYGHCNGMCYCPKDDKLYVAPSTVWDSELGERVQIDTVYRCSAYDGYIEDEISFDFHPHAIAYNDDADLFYVKERIANGCIIHVMNYELTQEVAEPITFIYKDYVNYGNLSAGKQNDMCYHDGSLYLQLSSSSINSLFVIDTNTMKYSRLISMSEQCGMFYAVEGEGITVNSKGLLYAFSKVGEGFPYACLYNVALSGNAPVYNFTGGESYETRGQAHMQIAVDPNTNIFFAGTQTKPYPTFMEAWLAASLSYKGILFVHGDCTITDYEIGSLTELEGVKNVQLINEITLTFDLSVPIRDVTFTPSNTSRQGTITTTEEHPLQMNGHCSIQYLNIDCAHSNTTYNATLICRAYLHFFRQVTPLNIPDGHNVVNAQQQGLVLLTSGAFGVTVGSNTNLRLYAKAMVE